MTVKTTYKCDVCRDEMAPGELYGVRFSDLKHFKLGDPIRHEGIHICRGCVQQILDQCNAPGKGANDA